MAAVSARRMRGPSDTGITNGSDRRRSRSSGAKPPSGPIKMAAGADVPARASIMPFASPPSSQKISRRSGSQPSRILSSFIGSSMTGTSSRPVCSAASMAMASRRPSLTKSTLVRRVWVSRTRRAPSSAAFSTMVSTRPRLTMAITRSRSGAWSCWRVCSSQRSRQPRLPASVRLQRHSPSWPLNTRISSPTLSRMTAVR